MTTFVLIHGFTGGPESFDELVSLLPSDARVIRPTLTGHCLAPALARSWDDEIERLVGGLRAEAVCDAHLVGYSLGGRIGYGLLQSAPELFARATLIGAHPGLSTPEERAERSLADRHWITLLLREGIDGFAGAWEALPMWESQRRLPLECRERQRALRRTHGAAGLAHALAVLGLGEMPPVDPSRIHCPVTLVSGALDTKHTALARELAAQLPRARHSVMPNSGHNVVLEAPDALAAIITEQF